MGGGSVSTLAKDLRILTTNGIELQVISSLTASIPLKAKLIIKFENSKLVRALKPLEFPIGLNGTGTVANTNITGCANTAEPPICVPPNVLSYDGSIWGCNPPSGPNCPSGQFFNGYDKNGASICGGSYTPSLRGSCRVYLTQEPKPIGPRDCWGTAAPASEADLSIVCKNNGKKTMISSGDDIVSASEFTLNPDWSKGKRIIDFCTDCVFLEFGCLQ